MKRPVVALPLLLAVALGALVACTGQPVAAKAASDAGAVAKAPQVQAAAPAAAAPAPTKVEDPKAVYRVPLEDVPLRGPADALVTIVEVSDFECPFCRRAAPTLERLLQAYPGQLRLAFRHNPLSMHASALPAALLAEEARAQGGDAGFWAAHDRLFALDALDAAGLTRVAGELKLDEARLKAAIAGRTHLERIRRDQNLVVGLGARGTPTFFVNGRKLVGAQPLEAMRAVVEEELARARALVKGGVKPAELYAGAIERGATAPVLIDGPPAAPAAPRAVPATPAAAVALRADDALKGPASAPVTVALFSDFQCPFCARVEPTLRDLQRDYPGKLRFAWRHQPLPFHPNALPAARAAEAARLQGKFWEMHDELFASQQQLSDATYARAAAGLGLDAGRFQRDLAAEATGRRIAEDQALAARVGATGTPTAFVNCRRITGAQPLAAFKALVDEELAAAEAARARGEAIDAGWYDRRCAANVAAAPAAAAPAPNTGLVVPLRSDDPARGAPAAKVTVVEFSDFQCPFCARAVPAVKALEQAHAKEVRVVWKHLPLAFHPNARPAALAAEAARQQGRFWEMHDRLFADQAALSEAAYLGHARALGLDLGRFQAAMASPETARRVDADAAAAGAVGVNGTPTFVVNGELVVGSGGLEAAVTSALERARTAK